MGQNWWLVKGVNPPPIFCEVHTTSSQTLLGMPLGGGVHVGVGGRGVCGDMPYVCQFEWNMLLEFTSGLEPFQIKIPCNTSNSMSNVGIKTAQVCSHKLIGWTTYTVWNRSESYMKHALLEFAFGLEPFQIKIPCNTSNSNFGIKTAQVCLHKLKA